MSQDSFTSFAIVWQKILTVNQLVVGSIPTAGAKLTNMFATKAARLSAQFIGPGSATFVRPCFSSGPDHLLFRCYGPIARKNSSFARENLSTASLPFQNLRSIMHIMS